MSACEECNGDKEISDSDPVSFRLLLPRYNKFQVHEFHYLISGLMLATIAWVSVFFFAFLFGIIKLGG